MGTTLAARHGAISDGAALALSSPSATIALAVAGIGMLAVPALMTTP